MAERSRLGDLLLDMRLVDQETLQAALQEQRTTHKRLATILAERRVLDEERLTKAVAARLGLESVALSSHKVHERVLGLIPYAVAKRYGLLPIAVKRTQQAEVLYLVMVDPLNTEALGEVQRLTGRQVRVLMASATELDQCIDRHYLAQAQAPARTPLPRPVQASTPPAGATPPPGRTPPRARVGSAVRPAPAPVAQEPGRTPRPVDPSARPPIRADGPPMETRPPRSSELAPVRGSPARGTPVPPGRPPVLSPDVPRAVPVRPAPFPMDGRLDLSNPATLIDTARPQALADLQAHLGGATELIRGTPLPRPGMPPPFPPPDAPARTPETLGGDLQVPEPRSPVPSPSGTLGAAPVLRRTTPVEPSDLDHPDAVATRVEENHSLRQAQSALKGQDWDLAVQDWDVPAWSGLDAPAAVPVERKPGESGAFNRGDEVTNLDGAWMMDPAPRPSTPEPPGGPEDIATSQLDVSADPSLWHQPVQVSRTTPPQVLASTLEVPMDFDDAMNPFEGPRPGEIPVGLEKTAIIPAIDFEAEPFEPPPVRGESTADQALVLGSDIPMSQAAVKARFGPPLGEGAVPEPPETPVTGTPAPQEDEDDIEAIEEVVLEPLDEEPMELLDVVDGAQADLPQEDEALSLAPEADSDAQAMPVIEPSSLVSFMDEDPGEIEDTGADVIPRGVAEPPTRLFDESSRRPGSVAPRHASETEEPTNPRMAAPKDELASDAPAPREEPSSARGATADDLSDAPAPAANIEAQATEAVVPALLVTPTPVPSASPEQLLIVTPPSPPAERKTPRPERVEIAALDPSGPPIEEPTPTRSGLDRAEVLSALDGAFVVAPEAPPAPRPVRERPGAETGRGPPRLPRSPAEPERRTPPSARPGPPEPGSETPAALVEQLLSGSSLSSSGRAQVLLALGRLMIDKGLVTREELERALASDD